MKLTLWMKPRLLRTAEKRILRTCVKWERRWAEIPYSVQSWELA
jgi:hypothetical protein